MVFIDGENFYNRLLDKGITRLDLKKMIDLICRPDRELVGIYYYDAYYIQPLDPIKYANQRRWIESVRKVTNKVFIVNRNKKFDKSTGKIRYTVKGDDIYLASHMVKFAYTNAYDTGILISGDGDFHTAIMVINEDGQAKKFENYYLNPNYSRLLDSQCEECIELTPIISKCLI